MSTPRSIAFIGQKGIPATWGGVEHHVEAVATRLAGRGHHVQVYVRDWYTGTGFGEYKSVELLRRPTIHTKYLDAATHSFVSSLDSLSRDCEIVHYHAMGPSLFSFLPKLAGRGVVATIHGLDYRRPKWGPFARTVLRAGEWCALRWPDQTLVVSEGLQRLYADRDHRTLYLPNGIDLPDPHPPSRIESELGLRGEDYLLFLGRWAGEKRVLELIEAFSELRCRGLKLVVAGTAEPETSHGRKTHRLASSTPGVILPGTVEGKLKEELLSNAFAFVSFSEVEGMPMALLEAMSHERPCLVSDIPAHRELLNGGRGLLRDVTTPRSRVDALRDLVSLSPTERRRMGRRAREDLHPTHDWDRLVDKLERLYAEVAGGTG